eukprot:29507-Pelagococcus_subviridis.AAC.6
MDVMQRRRVREVTDLSADVRGRGQRERLRAAAVKEVAQYRVGRFLEPTLEFDVAVVHLQAVLERDLREARFFEPHVREPDAREGFHVHARRVRGRVSAFSTEFFLREDLRLSRVPERLLEETEVEVTRRAVRVADPEVLVRQVVVARLSEHFRERGDASKVIPGFQVRDGFRVQRRDRAFFERRIGREHLVAQADDGEPRARLARLLRVIAREVLRVGGDVRVVVLLLLVARFVVVARGGVRDVVAVLARAVVHVVGVGVGGVGIGVGQDGDATPRRRARLVAVRVGVVGVRGNREPVVVVVLLLRRRRRLRRGLERDVRASVRSRPRRRDVLARGRHEVAQLERGDAIEAVAHGVVDAPRLRRVGGIARGVSRHGVRSCAGLKCRATRRDAGTSRRKKGGEPARRQDRDSEKEETTIN